MKIELRNVKYAAFASQETACFEAKVYIDGVQAGIAENNGHGGATMIHPRALCEQLDAYSATLPKKVISDAMTEIEYEQTGESLIDDLLTDWLIRRDLKQMLSKKVAFTKKSEAGVYTTRPVKADVLKAWLADPALKTKVGNADQILNLMPFDEALAIYLKSAD